MIQSEKEKLVAEIRSKKYECSCGKYCVQDGRNEGLEDAALIVLYEEK